MRLVIVHQLADHSAILAILIPAEASVGNGFRAEVLKAPEYGIFLRDLKSFPENLDLHQAFIGTKYLSRRCGRSRFGCLRFGSFCHGY